MLEGKIGEGPFFRVQSDELTVCLQDDEKDLSRPFFCLLVIFRSEAK